MESSQYPLSKHVAPLCETRNNQLFGSIRSNSETTPQGERVGSEPPKMDPTGYFYPDTTRLRSVPSQTTYSLTLRLWAQKVSKMKEVNHGRLGSSDNSTGQYYPNT